MTESIKAVNATIQLSDALTLDGYMMPDGEFRAGIAGASVLLGYAKTGLTGYVQRLPTS